MSDIDETGPSQLDQLKAKARTLGIAFSGNIGLETLRGKVNAAIEGTAPPAEIEEVDPSEETPEQRRARIRREQLALVRCQITCMDPSKAGMKTEMWTFHSRHTGTVKRVVPLNSPAWHLERCLFTMLEDMKFQQARQETVNGKLVTLREYVPMFALRELPPLTEKQLADLRAQQAVPGRMDPVA